MSNILSRQGRNLNCSWTVLLGSSFFSLVISGSPPPLRSSLLLLVLHLLYFFTFLEVSFNLLVGFQGFGCVRWVFSIGGMTPPLPLPKLTASVLGLSTIKENSNKGNKHQHYNCTSHIDVHGKNWE